MRGFDTVLSLFRDECAIELQENKTLPTVVDVWSPFSFEIEYGGGVWTCQALFWSAEDDDTYVTVRRQYTNEMVVALTDENIGEAIKTILYETRKRTGSDPN